MAAVSWACACLLHPLLLPKSLKVSSVSDHLDNLRHDLCILLFVHPDAFGWKGGKLQEEACFFSKTLKVREVEAPAIEAGCGRGVAALLRASIGEV